MRRILLAVALVPAACTDKPRHRGDPVPDRFGHGVVNRFRSHSRFEPGTGLSIVVLGNLDTVEPGRIAENPTTPANT